MPTSPQTFDKWNALLDWAIEAHDHAEESYRKRNFSSDEIEAAVLRKVVNAMVDLARKEAVQLKKASLPPAPQSNLRAGKRVK